MSIAIIVILVLFSGIFSGLNLGLLSLDIYDLQRKVKLGYKDAEKILPIRKNGNLLLSTLLIGNVIVNSILSVFLADLTTGLVGVIVSTSLIVIFGEIIPQSVFSRYALKFGAMTSPLTRVLLFILYPIAGPIAYVMNRALGDELPKIWSKDELREIIHSHELSPDSNLDSMDGKLIKGVLSFSDKKVEAIMTPKKYVSTLNEDKEIDEELMKKLSRYNFSRIPVYRKSKDRIVGILYIKDLLNVDEDEKLKVSDIVRYKSHVKVDKEFPLDNLLAEFIDKKVRIAMIYSDKRFVGIATLEDVLEEILQDELYDEIDQTSRARMLNYRQYEHSKEI